MSDQATTPTRVDEGRFERDTSYISDRILDEPDAQRPVEPGRYRLVVARACPWANRAVIVRRLLGLEDALSMGVAGPTHDWRSWKFDLDPGEVDPVARLPPRGRSRPLCRCNRHKLAELPVLWAYARDLFQTPGFGDTIDFVQIKQHYYLVHTDLNPSGIVPAGPDLSGWAKPHGREELGGSPFGEATPPPPPPPDERVPAEHNPALA